MGHRAANERAVHALPQHIVDQLGRRAGPQHEIDLGIAGRIARQQGCQAERRRSLERADGQRAPGRPIVAGSLHGVSEQARHLARIGEQPAPRLGQGDAAAMAVEQRAADLGLERLDARGDIGLHGVQLGRGAVHAPEPGHRLEHL